ncbi:MAG: type II toxin-antitoxin system RelE/ParE family toxin [Chloroflexi bacterium]|nr:type II toxin-antitoxin system RelE/ParE family toxin [Chloroflexota bacterium]
MANWRYVVTPHAERDLRRLDAQGRARVFDALDRYVAKRQRGDVKKLQGSDNEWRLRVGNWRVRFRVDTQEAVVVILAVRSRREAYREG